ncbi:MAG: hypothetical protein PHC70_04890, partial [Patescibacteria group bacterium]|nr:hypothetical protein [Patescibacteria group bacterium]
MRPLSYKAAFKTITFLFCGGFLLFGLAGKANAATYFVAKTASGTGSAGANTNTGKDNVGFGITGGSWNASTYQLTKAGAFISYTPVASDYIYVSSTASGQTGLYSNITKISADVIQLGTLVEGTGITTNQTDVSSSNGPWITIKYAVDTVPVGIQTIRVGAGTYDQGAASLSLTSAAENGKTLTLIGAIGGDNVPNDTIITGSLARAVIYNTGATTLDIDFQNFTITQANAAPNFVIENDAGGSNNMRFTNCIINGPAATAVGIEMYPVAGTSRGLYVTSTTFSLGPTSNGIRLYDAGTVVISGCTASGMGTFLQLYTGTAIGDITVTGCHITNSVGAFFASGVAAATTINSITLSNNTI